MEQLFNTPPEELDVTSLFGLPRDSSETNEQLEHLNDPYLDSHSQANAHVDLDVEGVSRANNVTPRDKPLRSHSTAMVEFTIDQFSKVVDDMHE